MSRSTLHISVIVFKCITFFSPVSFDVCAVVLGETLTVVLFQSFAVVCFANVVVAHLIIA